MSAAQTEAVARVDSLVKEHVPQDKQWDFLNRLYNTLEIAEGLGVRGSVILDKARFVEP
jgi:hypothetical protein